MQEFLFDPGPTIAVQEFFGPGLAAVFLIFSQLGTTWGVVLVAGGALWLWGRHEAYVVLGVLLIEAAVSLGLNMVFGVPRPDAPGLTKHQHVEIGSFPSGHVFVTTVLWGVLYARGRLSVWIAAAAVLLAAIARLYLGVHYVVDVVAGAVLGVLLVAVYVRILPHVQPRVDAFGEMTWVAACVLALGGVAAGSAFGLYGENAYSWHTAGLIAGGAPALLLERRYVRYEPSGDVRGRLPRLLTALLVIIAIAWLDRLIGERPFLLGAVLIAIGAAWAFAGAPATVLRTWDADD